MFLCRYFLFCWSITPCFTGPLLRILGVCYFLCCGTVTSCFAEPLLLIIYIKGTNLCYCNILIKHSFPCKKDLIFWNRLSGYPNMKRDGASHAAKLLQPVLKLMNEDSSDAVCIAIKTCLFLVYNCFCWLSII